MACPPEPIRFFNFMKYSDLLKDPRWQKKKNGILDRDNYTCIICGETKLTLHVHHKSYNGKPWEINDDQLITLCEICHEKAHGKNVEITKISMPTKNTLATCISVNQINKAPGIIIQKFNELNKISDKRSIEYKSLLQELNLDCQDNNLIIVGAMVTYGYCNG